MKRWSPHLIKDKAVHTSRMHCLRCTNLGCTGRTVLVALKIMQNVFVQKLKDNLKITALKQKGVLQVTSGCGGR